MNEFEQFNRAFFSFRFKEDKNGSTEQIYSNLIFLRFKFVFFVAVPYVVLIFGLLSNMIMFCTVYRNRKTTIYNHFMLAMLLFDSLYFTTIFANLIEIESPSGQRHTLMTQSAFMCQLFSYLNHILTSMSNWMKALIWFKVTSTLQSFNHLESIRAEVLIILAGLVFFSLEFLTDLFYVDRLIINGHIYICAIQDAKVRLATDFVDIITFFFVPFYFVINYMRLFSRLNKKYSVCSSQINLKYQKLVLGGNLAAISYTCFNIPISVVPIILDLCVCFDIRYSSLTFNILMYISHFLFCLNKLLNVFYNFYYNRNLRKTKKSENSAVVKLNIIR